MPSSTHTVVVNVWSSPTSFVASGSIVIFASTNVFVAGPLLSPVASVVRVRESPPSTTVPVALPTTWPAVADVNVTSNSPDTFVRPSIGPPGTGTAPFWPESDTVTSAPVNRSNVPISPSRSLFVPSSTHIVVTNVWSSPTSFVASGSIVIFASTNVFSAAPLLFARPSVKRATVTLLTSAVAKAVPMTCPVVGDVKVTPNSPFASVTPASGPTGAGTAPFAPESTMLT